MLILQNFLQILCSASYPKNNKEPEPECEKLQGAAPKNSQECSEQRNTGAEAEYSAKLPSFQKAFGHLQQNPSTYTHQAKMVDSAQRPYYHLNTEQHEYDPNNYELFFSTIDKNSLAPFDYHVNSNTYNTLTSTELIQKSKRENTKRPQQHTNYYHVTTEHSHELTPLLNPAQYGQQPYVYPYQTVPNASGYQYQNGQYLLANQHQNVPNASGYQYQYGQYLLTNQPKIVPHSSGYQPQNVPNSPGYPYKNRLYAPGYPYQNELYTSVYQSPAGQNPLTKQSQINQLLLAGQLQKRAYPQVGKQPVAKKAKSNTVKKESNLFNEIFGSDLSTPQVIADKNIQNDDKVIVYSKPFGGYILEKSLLDSIKKLSVLIEDIDNQISIHLSEERIKEQFIYNIFFDPQLKVKEEFIFLIFVIPEIEVMTLLYSEKTTNEFVVDLSNQCHEQYKKAVKSLISFYKDVLDEIIDNNIFFTFGTIENIIDYFLINMNEEIKRFRTCNSQMLKTNFAECDSYNLYDSLVKASVNAKTFETFYKHINMFHIVFLNRDWFSKISKKLFELELILCKKALPRFGEVFKYKNDKIYLFKNLSVFCNLLKQKYFKGIQKLIHEYDYEYEQFYGYTTYIAVKTIQNGVLQDKDIRMEDYLILKYNIYCEKLLYLYLQKRK